MKDESTVEELPTEVVPSNSFSNEDSNPITKSPRPELPNELKFPDNPDLQTEAEGTFIWPIPQYSKTGKTHSDYFVIGSSRWKLLIFPRGNEPHEGQSMSLYICIDPPQSDDWAVCAQVILTVFNPKNPSACLQKYTQHRFDSSESDWGFTNFCNLKTLTYGDTMTGNIPILFEDSLVVKVEVRIVKDETGVLWHNFYNYNSKKVTGFVGLANQGATCYMNSLLQSLYFTNAFRKAIYQIPTEGESPIESSALALQRIFWRLQYGDCPASTQELTQAFGWDTLESFIQSDVQEFSRVLMDELEARFKKTPLEGTVERLFTGKVRNVIKCLNVDYASTRTESFYDLQLTIKGVKTLEESFESYVRAEMLQGDNKYHAEGFGLQDAKRFVEFESFPPVLHLHLERYAFDPRVMATVKINDRLEFPLQINLDKYLAEDSPQRGQPQSYILQSVFVHSGDSHGGHYYVYIRDPRTGKDHKWYKFDDTKVIPVTEKEAVEDTFGGVPTSSSMDLDNTNSTTDLSQSSRFALNRMQSRMERFKRFTNAYMLVYIRESEMNEMLCDIGENDIPAHIFASIKAEGELERRKKEERLEQSMSFTVRLITDKDVESHTGFDLFNLYNQNMPLTSHKVYKMKKIDLLRTLREEVARELNLSSENICLWTLSSRKNRTIRLDQPIPETDYDLPLASAFSRVSSRNQPAALELFAEIRNTPLQNTVEYLSSPKLSLIYFKFYDPEHSILRPVGKLWVNSEDSIENLFGQICSMVGLPESSSLLFYEEVKHGRADKIDIRETFSQLHIGTGDIICFQIANPIYSSEIKMPLLMDYFNDLLKRIKVNISSNDGKEYGDLHFRMNTPLRHIADIIGEQVGASGSNILLLISSDFQELIPIKSTIPTLGDALEQHSCLVGNEGIKLVFEVKNMPISEFEEIKQIKVVYEDRNKQEKIIEANVLPDDTLESFAARELPSAFQPPLRLLEIYSHRIVGEFTSNDSLARINEGSEFFLEGSVPNNEIELPEGHAIISVIQYEREPSFVHSRPFKLLILPEEPFSSTKGRILAHLGLDPSSEEVQKWSFSLISYGRAKPLKDEDTLITMISDKRSLHDQIGINRPNPHRTTYYSPNIERSLKIRSKTNQSSQ